MNGQGMKARFFSSYEMRLNLWNCMIIHFIISIKIVPNSSTHCNSSEPAHLYVTPILEMDPSTYSKVTFIWICLIVFRNCHICFQLLVQISWHHILGLILIFANGYIYALCIKKQVEEMVRLNRICLPEEISKKSCFRGSVSFSNLLFRYCQINKIVDDQLFRMKAIKNILPNKKWTRCDKFSIIHLKNTTRKH